MNTNHNEIIKELYDSTVDGLYRFAYFKLQSQEEEIWDLIQESFYKLSLELKSWKKIDNLNAYIYRILWNKIIDFYRKQKSLSLDEHIEVHGDNFIDNSSIENITHAKLEVEKIYRILAWLDDFEKDIFLLRYVEELGPKEIANIYTIPVNTITVRLHRIKEKISSQLIDPNETYE